MEILEKQSLQYLNFIYEEKELNYAFKQDISKVRFLNISGYFSKS